MTQNQLEWMQQSGLDPAQYDMAPDGRVLRRQTVPAEPQREVMSPLRAAGTSFLGNLLPSAAALAGGAAGMEGGAALGALGGPAAPVTVPLFSILGGIGGGLGAGYLGGKGQQAALEKFSPEALQQMAQAEQDQPVASWIGGSAPALITFKPTLRGIEGLSAPLMGGQNVMAKFAPAAMNVGVNAANAAAGQLVNMSEGGEFSAPRFAADVALGSILANPNRLGRKLGFHSLTPETAPVERLDLAGENARRAGVETEQARTAALGEDEAASARATELLGTKTPVEETPVLDTRRSNIERNRENITRELERMGKQKLPEDLVQDLANDPFIPGEDPAALQEWLAGKAEKYLDSTWKESLSNINETSRKLEESMAKEEVAEFDREQARREEAKNLGIKDIQPARDAAEEIHQRFQRPGEEGAERITQEDLDAASEIAARRGLKLTFADLEGGRGSFQLETPDGKPLIKIDPAAATRDTAIHEIGHDVYARSVGERMRKGLVATAEDSPAFKAEFEARMAARDEQGNPRYTEQQARDLALEEGVIQAFGERYPNIKSGAIRQWFNALKASMKDLVGMKLSPEDAAAYLHYMTHEAVPWKGAAVAKVDVGEERMQRALENDAAYLKAVESGDNETAQRMVDAAAKAAGYTIGPVYHGSSENAGEFNEFAPKNSKFLGANFFTPDYEIGVKFANRYGDSNREPRKFYLKLENPLIDKIPSREGRDATGYDQASEAKQLGHDSFILSPIGERIAGGKLKYSKQYGVFDSNNIKSADPITRDNAGNVIPLSERFKVESSDIRYQRGPIDRLRNFAEVDSLESRGGIFSQVAQGMRSYYATRKFMQGQASAKERIMSSLSPERQVMLGKHIGQELDQQRFIQPPSEIAAAYNEYRNEWQKFWPTETNKAGHTVRTAGGQRARLTDPYYGPFHMWSDSVRDIITTKQGSPEYVKLKDDYIKQHTQFHQQNGVPLQEAQTRSLADFNDAIREMSVPYDPTAVGTFAGARKAQGIPLPESWREYNIMKLVENYDRRSAMDYAMQEHMEKSPEIMAALGAEKYFNDQPIPPQIKASVPYIGDDNSVKSILREMSGKPAFRPDALGAGASRGIGALTIGTVSKATEVPTTMIAGLRYLQMSDYLPGTMKFIENLADWSALQERSYASGLNKRDGAQNMRQVAGVIGDASGYMNKFAETVSKYTGLNALEQGARTIAQGWGEVLVQINKRKAATGDKEAVRMLDTLSPDWRTRSDADLAGQFGQLMQGSYDMTQLPAWMLESGAAPYLTWSKWSAGQYNSFMKFAIEPALQGNVKPLLGHLLIGVMGGAAVEQIREWMNNREGRDVNWSELESWMQQNQGELGAEGMKQLSVKLLNMVQNVGTFGIAGDLAKMVTTAAVGGTAQGMATAPVANAVFDTSKKIAAALKAIDDGEDFGLVLRQMMLDVAKSHVQVARVGQNWLDEDENLRYDDRRKRRLFDELTGAPTQGGTFSVNYGNLAEREFERGEITPQTSEEAFSLVSRAREEATTPEDYASRIRKYKTSQNQIMPSLERQPMKAARYLSFVEGAEEGAGAETLRRYMTREYENKYRKSLIEGMSGLR
jgi:hypothetical protein